MTLQAEDCATRCENGCGLRRFFDNGESLSLQAKACGTGRLLSLWFAEQARCVTGRP